MLVDTHCHLDFPEFDNDRSEVIFRATENDIWRMVNIGSSLEGSIKSVELAGLYDSVYAAVGFHPHEADNFNENTETTIRNLAQGNKVVAIGEIGLDYYKNYSQGENQRSCFIALLELAKDLNLPVVIHNRQAEEDALKILGDLAPLRAVVHCFSGSPDFLRECLRMGFLISFTCNITYKKAQNLRDLLKSIPLERIMLETDSPFLSPEGLRGQRNEPSNVRFVASEIARIKEESLEEVCRVTTENAKEFFQLK